MTLWVVRAGRYGEGEDYALGHGTAVIGWGELPDLTGVAEKDELEGLIREAFPAYQPGRVTNHAGQINAFMTRMAEGDLVALPLKTRPAIAIGEVTGPYTYVSDAPTGICHTRPVRWLRTDMPRGSFDQDLLHSFGGMLTVFQVSRNNAEARVRQMVEGRTAPLMLDGDGETAESFTTLDIEEHATDQIRSFISRKFRGHELSRLIAGILEAQGYHVYTAPAGPDGGIDILAGGGPMGFAAPRIAVQVKSSDTPADVSVLRELQGVMPRFGADQGMVVSWGGFKDTVMRESRQLFFNVRLWNSNDIIAALAATYHQLPDDLQAEIPIKQVWTLAADA